MRSEVGDYTDCGTGSGPILHKWLFDHAAVRLPFCCQDNSMVSDSAGRYLKEEASDVCVMEQSLRVMEVSFGNGNDGCAMVRKAGPTPAER